MKKSLPEQVIETPQEFEADQVVYILETIRKSATPLGVGSNPANEVAKFGGKPSVVPPITEIESISVDYNKLPVITINTSNIVGINGPLPESYSELVLERLKNKDDTFLKFLDIFQHRLFSLWNRLTKNRYPYLTNEPGYNTKVGAVRKYLANQEDLDQPLNIFFDFFWKRTRSIKSLLYILNHLTGINFKGTPFQGSWIEVDETEATAIGSKLGRYNALGKDAVVGKKSWHQASGFNLEVDDLDYQILLDTIPLAQNKQSRFMVICDALTRLMGKRPKVKMYLRPKKNQIPGVILNNQSALGWNSWLKDSQGIQDLSYAVITVN